MNRPLNDWANDHSLFHRLRDSVQKMMRSKGKFNDRASYAIERLRPITTSNFPSDLAPTFETFRRLAEKSVWYGPLSPVLSPGGLTSKERQVFGDALLTLYDAMSKERVRQNID